MKSILPFLFCLVLAGCAAYEGDDPGECSDEADNDRDGLFDCADPDCVGSPPCSEADADTDADADGDTDTDADSDADGDTDADSDADADADADSDADADADADSDADADADCSTLVTYTGDLTFNGFASTEMKAFCSGGYNAISGSLILSSVDTVAPLSCLCEVGNNLVVSNGTLTDLGGLTNVRSVGGLSVDVPGLTDIDGFDDLEEIGGSLTLQGDSLTDISGFPNLRIVGDGFNFPTHAQAPYLADVSGLNAWQDHGAITIRDTSLEHLSGLNALGNFGSTAALAITDNAYLEDVTGLSAAFAVPYMLDIDNNARLESIVGLRSITRIGTLYIRDNPVLSQAEIDAFIAAVGSSNIHDMVISDNGS